MPRHKKRKHHGLFGSKGAGKKCAGLKRGKKGRKVLRKGFTWKGARGGCPRKVK